MPGNFQEWGNFSKKIHKIKQIDMLGRVRAIAQRIIPWGLSVLFAIATFALGLPDAACAQSLPDGNAPKIAAVSAEEAFRAAYDYRYTWDEDFPGYSAEVSTNYKEELDQGIVRVNPNLSVEVANIERDDLRELIENQLRMEVIHRRRVPFEELHGGNSFELAGTDESGTLTIREVGDEEDSVYKVRNDVIMQVNRTFGDVAVTVDTIGTIRPPEGYLVTHFQTEFRDAETGEIIEKQDVRDFYEKIGSYYLLTNRTIRKTEAGNPERQLVPDVYMRFNDVQPL
jgi:hypothetical protein